VLVAHTNGQDIKEANGGSSFNLAKSSVKVDVATSAEAFGINVKEEVVAPSFDDIETTDEVEELDLVEEETFEL
jgi:hypothetical protein